MNGAKLDFDAWLEKRAGVEAAAEDDALGQEIFAWLDEEIVIEKSGWAVDMCERAAARLQAVDPPGLHKRPVVYWSDQRTAFAIPGRYIYVSRRLLEEAMPPDSVALIFAHELAHHRLGHVRHLLPALRWARRTRVAHVASFIAIVAVRLATSREQELAADAWALERCLDAGYDGRACLRLFDVLRNVAEDYGDLDMAHGPGSPEALARRELEKERTPRWRQALSGLFDRSAQASWEMARGYPSLLERRERLEAMLAARPR